MANNNAINSQFPSSSTDNALVRFDGTTGRAIQGSSVIINDSNNITGVGTLSTTSSITCGSALTVSTGAVSIQSGTSAINIGTDANARAVTVGTTTTSSSLALKYGTSDFTLSSVTGTIMSALDTGEITTPLQPAFLAYLGTNDNNVTGAGAIYTMGSSGNALTEVFDQNADFNTNGTFTAPVTGRYYLNAAIRLGNATSAMTNGIIKIVTSNRDYGFRWHPYNLTTATAAAAFHCNVLADMDAADTATVTLQVSNGASDTLDIISFTGPITFICGVLVA
jgi:hypothetical protein